MVYYIQYHYFFAEDEVDKNDEGNRFPAHGMTKQRQHAIVQHLCTSLAIYNLISNCQAIHWTVTQEMEIISPHGMGTIYPVTSYKKFAQCQNCELAGITTWILFFLACQSTIQSLLFINVARTLTNSRNYFLGKETLFPRIYR